MLDDTGNKLTDSELLTRVLDMGALVVRRGPVESLDFTTWRRQLRATAKTRGIRIRVHQAGDGVIVVSNPDHVVDPQRLRAAVNALPSAADLGLT